jgi:hypothetical protein
MWLQALFTEEDLTAVLSRLTPARIALDKDDPDRFLWVSKPESLRLEPDRSINITVRAQVRWDVLGVGVPITLKRVTLSLKPAVRTHEGRQIMTFGVQLEEADLSGVPAFIEKSLVGRVNQALEASEAKLSWAFLETLDFKFDIPVIEPTRKMSLYARFGSTQVTPDGLTLVVGWGVDAELADPSVALDPPDIIADVVAPPAASEPAGGPRPRPV